MPFDAHGHSRKSFSTRRNPISDIFKSSRSRVHTLRQHRFVCHVCPTVQPAHGTTLDRLNGGSYLLTSRREGHAHRLRVGSFVTAGPPVLGRLSAAAPCLRWRRRPMVATALTLAGRWALAVALATASIPAVVTPLLTRLSAESIGRARIGASTTGGCLDVLPLPRWERREVLHNLRWDQGVSHDVAAFPVLVGVRVGLQERGQVL